MILQDRRQYSLIVRNFKSSGALNSTPVARQPVLRETTLHISYSSSNILWLD